MSWIKQFFADNDGRVVLWQRPNVFLLVWLLASLVRWQATGRLADIAGLVAFASIVVWAILEMLNGASYFRRLLGLVVFGFSLYAKLIP